MSEPGPGAGAPAVPGTPEPAPAPPASTAAKTPPSTLLPEVHEAWLPREHALHRPRHGGRQLTALICALVFFGTPSLLWLFGVRPGEIENHALAEFPSPSQGWGLLTGLPAWATDQLSFRGGAILAADGISRSLFGEAAPLDQGGTIPGGPLPGAPPADAPTAGGAGQLPQSQAGYRRVVEGSDGWLYYGADADSKCKPMRPLADTLARLNKLRRAVESSGRKFVFVVPPDKSTMVPQFLPASYPGKDCHDKAEASTWSQLTGTGRAVDLRPGLIDAARVVGRPIYPSNDTHWSDEGSLVLTRELAEAVRPGVTRTWTAPVLGPFTGPADLPPMLGRQGTKTNTVYELRPDGVHNRLGTVVTDIDQPSEFTGPPTPGTIDQRTLVLGDSFLRASSPYLMGAFNNLTLMAYPTDDRRAQQVADTFAAADVVVVEVVERNISAGTLSFLDDESLNVVRTTLAKRPLR